MTQKSRSSFQATVRNGHPSDVRCYGVAMAQALKDAKPDDDFLDLNPFRGVCTPLAEAVYRLAVDKIRGGAREKRVVEDEI